MAGKARPTVLRKPLEGALPRIFYRLLTSDQAPLDDFRSYAALGKVPPREKRDDSDFLHRWQGLSVYDTYREARRLARARGWKRWVYIGVLRISDDAPIVYEGPDDHGRWNLYNADPVFLKHVCLIRIVHAPSVMALLPEQ